jgi:hypothetical protein
MIALRFKATHRAVVAREADVGAERRLRVLSEDVFESMVCDSVGWTEMPLSELRRDVACGLESLRNRRLFVESLDVATIGLHAKARLEPTR